MSFSDKLKIKPDFLFQELCCVTSLHDGEQVNGNKAQWDGSLTTVLRAWAAAMSQRQGAGPLMRTWLRDWCCHSNGNVLDCICVGSFNSMLVWLNISCYRSFLRVLNFYKWKLWVQNVLVICLSNHDTQEYPASEDSLILFSENIFKQATNNTSLQLWGCSAGVTRALW